MGMFSNLMGKIFGKDEDEAKTEETEVAAEEAAAEGEEGVVGEVGEAAPASDDAPAAEEAAPAPEPVDTTALLDEMSANSSEDLDWRKSIVDLMKLVGMDASYSARKELAVELGNDSYEGSAEDNIALHKQVLGKIVENGGTVPAELLD